MLIALARFDPLPVIPSIADRALPSARPERASQPRPRTPRQGERRPDRGQRLRPEIQGSGWVVRPGIVATNAHVVAGEHDAAVEFPTGPTLTGVPIAVDAGNDVALLRVARPAPPPLRLSPRGSLGEAVAILIGYPRERPADGGRRTGRTAR